MEPGRKQPCVRPRRRRAAAGVRAAVAGCGLYLACWAAGRAFLPGPGRLAPPRALPSIAPAAAMSELLPGAAMLAGGLSLAGAASADILDSNVDLSPETFRPVCPASDGIYSLGKGVADGLLGGEGAEYRPLAIEALLRVRLEICVLESFLYEAIVPFVQKKGLGWILPLHETLDTVIAGTVFVVAVNFILFGTTKILAVISIYHDFLIGAPLRLIGYAILPEFRPKEKPWIQLNLPGMTAEEDMPEEPEEREPPPVPLAIFGGACKGYGTFAEITKNVLEGLDTFVGRYLVIASVTYVIFKWAHFRLFNDFPPF